MSINKEDMSYDAKLQWFGTVGLDFSAQSVRQQLDEVVKSGAKSVLVEMNSAGGSVSEALEIVEIIQNAVRAGLDMHCHVVAECASAATAILAAFPKRSAKYATFTFHEVWMHFDGQLNMTSSKQYAKMLEVYAKELAKVYVQGYGMESSVAERMLTGENTLTTDEAYALGILNAEPVTESKELILNLFERDIKKAKSLVEATQQTKNEEKKMEKPKFNFKKLKIGGQVRRAVLALDLQTDAGLLIITADSLEEAAGAMAMLEDGTPANGEYTMEDGTVIVAEDGIVTEVILPANEPQDSTEGEAEIVNEKEEESEDKVENKKEPFGSNVNFKRTHNKKEMQDLRAQVLKRLGL
jgi:ATP-dependent protease ClpP protease subunit